jgi:serine/threonine-protein kinase HipA
MTSKDPSECFVYITLPGNTKSVTAGKLVVSADRKGSSIGQFVYGKSYLSRDDAVEIDPIELKLSDKTFRTTFRGGIFRSFSDAGPDYWGRSIIEKYCGRPVLSEIDYLLESSDDQAGALGFGLNVTPPSPARKYRKAFQLSKIQEIANTHVRNLNTADEEVVQVKELLLIGTSMGGMRPKVVVEDDDALWIAKLSRPDDRWNVPRVEFCMLELARVCGIKVAQSRIEKIGDKDVLLVKRFDRQKMVDGYLRARMISALTILQAEESPLDRRRWSYLLLAEELRKIVSDPKDSLRELFKRICFNALISNTDDHPRNHSILSFDKRWKLSPAYDLTPSLAVSLERRELALTCGSMGRLASAKNLLTQSSRFLLSADEATYILDELTNRVHHNWYGVCRAQGLSERDAELFRAAFVYPGFTA